MEGRLYTFLGAIGGHDQLWIILSHLTLTVIIVFLVSKAATKNLQLVPSGTQNVMETYLQGVVGMGTDSMGAKNAKIFMPLIATLGFIIGVVGWLYILGELYMGEASRSNIESGNEASHLAFNGLRLILTIGWAIYPLGYFINNLGGGVDVNSLNIIYNLTDFLNKIIFGFVIYRAAMNDTQARIEENKK